jgi:hypothetical protein
MLRNPTVHYRVHKRPHLSLSRNISKQPKQSHLISSISVAILSSHLSLGLPSCLVPSDSPHKKRISLLPMRATNTIWWGEQIIKGHHVIFSNYGHNLQYLPRHPVLTHPLGVSSLNMTDQIFICTLNSRRNYGSAAFNLYASHRKIGHKNSETESSKR